MEKDIDHVAARVTVSGMCGAVLGGAVATYRGYAIPKMTWQMGLSWSMTATACIGTQKLASVACRDFWKMEETSDHVTLGTHAVGGMLGGGLVGYLYVKKPLRGMVLMVPVMLMVGLGEIRYQEHKRIREMSPTAAVLKPTRGLDGSLLMANKIENEKHEQPNQQQNKQKQK